MSAFAMMDIGGFLCCALLILFSGSRLARHGERLAELTGWSRAWLGLVLMATVTSLPELFVGIGSAGMLHNADLAVGDVLGSCVFNLFILSMLDALYKKKTLLGRAAPGHVLAASLGIILLALVGVGVFLPSSFVLQGWFGGMSLLFIVIYLLSMRLLHAHEKNAERAREAAPERADRKDGRTMRYTVTHYALNALVVIAAALVLPRFAEGLAISTGLGATFIGTLLLAVSTSLPEVSVSISALRLGSLDMAVGNLFGSNLFNVLILAIDDLVYTNGTLLHDASGPHMITVLSTIVMTAIAIVGLTFRTTTKRFLLAWDTFLILAVYVVNLVIVYRMTAL